MNNKFVIVILLGMLYSCGPKKTAETSTTVTEDQPLSTAQPAEDPQRLKEEARDVFGDAAVNTKAAGLVDVESLKGLLPAELNGMPRAQLFGEAANALGFNIVEANGVYTTAQGENLSIDILDTGGQQNAIMMFAAWSKSEVNQQGPNGHEKTVYIGDQKVVEQYNPATMRGELSTLINMRYVVKLRGKNVTLEKLYEDLAAFGPDKFKALGP